MSNYKDFRNKDTAFTGTKGIDLPTGTTGQRDTGHGSGTLRYNSTTNLMEYYNGTDWKAVDAPPVITNFNIDGGSAITSYTIDNEDTGNVTMTINGSLFDTTGAQVTMLANTGSNVAPDSTTRNSTNLITCVFDASDFTTANGPYTLQVTNGSGLAATLADAVTADQAAPVFTNAADTIYSIYDGSRSSLTIAAGDLCGATDADAESLTYSVQSGSLPSGLTLNTSTGAITGSVSAVGSDTTSTFTIRVTDGTTNVDRQFKITVKPPQRTTYTSPATFAVPTGVSTLDVLLVAGGGGAGGFGGGGAGGLIYRPAMPVSGQVTVTVGNGGAGGAEAGGDSYEGQDSVFGTLTAKGGGGGGQAGYGPDLPENENVGDGEPGGSGGGGGHPNNTALGGSGGQAGAATQPTQPGDSGTYGFGNPGGRGRNDIPSNSPEPVSTAGGGGGAGGAGGDGNAQSSDHGGAGGIGRAYSIADGSTQVYYAGGGGGSYGGNPGQGGGGNGSTNTGQNQGTANRGGGGGTRYAGGPGNGGAGGSGVVIISY